MSNPGGGGPAGPLYEHYWAAACQDNSPASGVDTMCAEALACPQNSDPSSTGFYIRMFHFQREVDRVTGEPGDWTQVGTVCRGPDDPAPQGVQGPSLPELVVREWRSLQIPEASVTVQPDGRTLVNLPTIVHTTTGRQTFDLTILGRAVQLIAIPVSYDWDFGDGAGLSTEGPGRPYPAKDITHTYTSAGPAQVRVDVTYRAEFTVDGGQPQPLPGQTTVTGDPAPVEVVQARSQLIDGGG